MALFAAVVLGVSGGIVAAFVAPIEQRGTDPLGLGVPFENVTCTGATLVLVDWGENYEALAPSVADWDGVRYLETAKSCRTAYPREDGRTPTYAAYLPPFATTTAACSERMSSEHRGDFTTRMTKGNVDGVNCACELDVATLPALGEGQDPTTESGMWISLYQTMLADVDALTLDDVQLGSFDDEMIEITREFQTNGGVSPTAVTDEDTWRLLRDQVCSNYDYH